jgi:hypothetical protein
MSGNGEQQQGEQRAAAEEGRKILGQSPSDLAKKKREDFEHAIRKVVADPVYFASAVLSGFEPYPYQRKFLRDMSPRIVVCAGRQVGKSTMTAARALWFAIARAKTTTLIVSSTLRQSMLMFNKITGFVEGSNLLKGSVKRSTRREIVFTNRSSIVALPCGPFGSSLRGHTAHLVCLDEASFVPESVISEVIFPMLATTKGTMIMLSTPYDRSHSFYNAFTSPTWSKYHFPSSVNPLVSAEFLEEMRELYGEKVFRQEYLAEFVEDERAYFPMSLLRSCVHVCSVPTTAERCEFCEVFAGRADPPAGADLYAGNDPGGIRDPAALVIVQKCVMDVGKDPLNMKRATGFRVVRAETYVLPRGKSAEEEESLRQNIYTDFTVKVADMHKKMRFKRLFVDSSGLGEPIVEHYRQLGVPVEGMKLTQDRKQELFSNMRLLFEDRRVVVPNDVALLSNMNCIEAERTRMGGFSFEHRSGTHDDLAYALALALWAGGRGGGGKVIMMMKQGDDDKPTESSWRQLGGGF